MLGFPPLGPFPPILSLSLISLQLIPFCPTEFSLGRLPFCCVRVCFLIKLLLGVPSWWVSCFENWRVSESLSVNSLILVLTEVGLSSSKCIKYGFLAIISWFIALVIALPSWYAGFGLGGFCSWVWFWHGPGLVVGFYVVGLIFPVP